MAITLLQLETLSTSYLTYIHYTSELYILGWLWTNYVVSVEVSLKRELSSEQNQLLRIFDSSKCSKTYTLYTWVFEGKFFYVFNDPLWLHTIFTIIVLTTVCDGNHNLFHHVSIHIQIAMYLLLKDINKNKYWRSILSALGKLRSCMQANPKDKGNFRTIIKSLIYTN